METSSMEKTSAEIIIIEPKKGWQPLDWKEAWRYKDLFYFLVWRDVKIVYKQTILGFGWAILRPLLGMVIFSVVFGRLAKLPSDGVPYPVFSYTALVPWTYFSAALSGSTQSLITQASVFTKVYFPRLFIPLTAVFSKLLDFLIAFAVLGFLFVYFKIVPPWKLMVYLPFLILLMTVTACGMGLWLSAVAVQYRDVKHAVEFASQFLMYAAPVVWPASLIPAKYRLIYGLYPMAGVIEGFRSCLIGAKPMPWDLIAMGTLSAIVMTVSGAYYFKRMERIFADVA
jgi:ABC-type polysaccharide/polyol phosphate export systems, permease component